MDPQLTLALLARLEKMGFDADGDDFWRVHHFRLRGVRETKARFRSFAGTVNSFQRNGNNRLVHERLRWVNDACVDGKLPRGRTFTGLAEDAWAAIPVALRGQKTVKGGKWF